MCDRVGVSETYDTIGPGYARYRQPDPRIEAAIGAALGEARRVVNVGAGAGSYEPREREVIAVEPSQVMIAQRRSAAPVIRAVAEALPLATDSVDAALAVLTVHHWQDWRRGIAELRRVARGPVVVLTHDSDAARVRDFWLVRDYFPDLGESMGVGMPDLEALCALLGATAHVLPVPADCVDGFLASYWRRPERYLDPQARAAISTFHMLAPAAVEAGAQRLAADLASGAWRQRHGALLEQDAADYGYRLVVAT